MTDNAFVSPATPTPRRLLNIQEAAEALGVSRWSLYQLIQREQLRSVKIGSRRLVPVRALDDLVAQLEAEPDTVLL